MLNKWRATIFFRSFLIHWIILTIWLGLSIPSINLFDFGAEVQLVPSHVQFFFCSFTCSFDSSRPDTVARPTREESIFSQFLSLFVTLDFLMSCNPEKAHFWAFFYTLLSALVNTMVFSNSLKEVRLSEKIPLCSVLSISCSSNYTLASTWPLL